MLRVEQVSKRFAQRGFADTLRRRPPRVINALTDVSLDVAVGECTALLGPNGAGKTTLLNICAGLVRPDAGTVCIAGRRYPKQLRTALGDIGLVTTSDRSFFWRLSGRQNLHFFAALHGIDPIAARHRAQELLEIFGLRAHADRLYLSYSTGMKKRLALARALLHDPSVLLLDEATNGLDAEGTEQLLDVIRELVIGRGRAAVWATHRSEEVPALCDSVVVLLGGRICYRNTVDGFSHSLQRGSGARVELRRPEHASAAVAAVLARHGVVGTERPGGLVLVLPPEVGDAVTSVLLGELLKAGAHLDRIEEDRPSLADLFSRLREDEREHPGEVS